MSYAKRFTIKAAMEEIEQAAADTTAVVEETPIEEQMVVADAIEPAAVAETDMIEMSDATSDIDAGQDQTEQVMSDADSLTEIADSLEASEQTGGIDENAAKVVEVAVESLYKRLGITKRALPALESFGTTSTRTKATKVAVESVRENVKKAWQAVIAMLAKIGEFIKKFFDAMFNSVAKLGERAKNLLARIKGTKQEESVTFLLNSEQFEANKSTLLALSNEGVIDLDFTVKHLDGLNLTIDELNELAKDQTDAAMKSEALKAMGEETPDLSKAESVTAAFTKMPESKDGQGDIPEGMKVVNIGEPSFGQQLQAIVPKEAKDGVEAVEGDSKSKVRMYMTNKAGEIKKMVSASKDAVIKTLTKVIDTLAKLTKAKEAADASKKAYETVTAGAKKAGNKIAETASAALKTLQRWASNIVSFITKPFILFGNFVMKTCKAVVDLVEILVNKVKGTKADEPQAALPAPAAA